MPSWVSRSVGICAVSEQRAEILMEATVKHAGHEHESIPRHVQCAELIVVFYVGNVGRYASGRHARIPQLKACEALPNDRGTA